MKKTLLILSVAAGLLAACGGGDDAKTAEAPSYTAPVAGATSGGGEKLIAKSDCIGCHTKDRKIIGPSYIDIAAKYPATEENKDLLASHIINGSKGVWGNLLMTPHPKLTKEEAKEMVTYILSLKK